MLKLDLLPAHYTVARRNKKVMILSVPMLVGVVLAWLLVMVSMKGTIARTQADYDKTKIEADAVRKTQDATTAKQAELAPIAAKVDFIKQADKSGGQYWERFHQINKYIYDRALVTNFSIAPPDGVSFSVTLETTEDAGRFILNMIRCPYVTAISISGQPSQGGQIQGIGGAGGGAPSAAGPGAPGMPPGGPGMPPGGPGMPPGGPGMPPGGPGMPPGGPGMAGPTPAAGGAGPITFSVTARLVQAITIPAPPGGAAAASMGGPGGPGMPPGGPGGPGGGPPGAGPGGPGPAGGGPSGEAPSGPKGGKADKAEKAAGGDE